MSQSIRFGIVLLLTGLALGCTKSKSESGDTGGSFSPAPSVVTDKPPKTSPTQPDRKLGTPPKSKPKETKLDPVEAFDRQMYDLDLMVSHLERTFDPKGIRIYSVRTSAKSVDLSKITNPPFLFGLRLGIVKLTNSDLIHLKNLTNLRWLWLSGQNAVTDKGLAHVQDLTGLQELFLERTTPGITDAGLAYLSKMTDLRRLILRGNSKITNEGMKHLAGMTKLKWIDLWNTQVTDAGLRNLKEMHDLIFLDMQGVTDERFAMLCEFGVPHAFIVASTDAEMASRAKNPQEVVFLDFSRAPITDATLERIKVFENLVELHLTATKITEAGLIHLHGLKKLKRLSVVLTPVSEDGVSRLKKVLPNCDIRR